MKNIFLTSAQVELLKRAIDEDSRHLRNQYLAYQNYKRDPDEESYRRDFLHAFSRPADNLKTAASKIDKLGFIVLKMLYEEKNILKKMSDHNLEFYKLSSQELKKLDFVLEIYRSELLYTYEDTRYFDDCELISFEYQLQAITELQYQLRNYYYPKNKRRTPAAGNAEILNEWKVDRDEKSSKSETWEIPF